MWLGCITPRAQSHVHGSRQNNKNRIAYTSRRANRSISVAWFNVSKTTIKESSGNSICCFVFVFIASSWTENSSTKPVEHSLYTSLALMKIEICGKEKGSSKRRSSVACHYVWSVRWDRKHCGSSRWQLQTNQFDLFAHSILFKFFAAK